MFSRTLLFTALVLAYFAYWTHALPAQMTLLIHNNGTVHAKMDHNTPHIVGQNRTMTQSTKKAKNSKSKESVAKKHQQPQSHKEASMAPNAFLPRSRFCGQHDSKNATINAMAANVTSTYRALLEKKSKKTGRGALQMVLADQKMQVEVVFNVIHDGSDGNLSTSAIDGQIQALNTACA